jgi:hypothetical protein
MFWLDLALFVIFLGFFVYMVVASFSKTGDEIDLIVIIARYSLQLVRMLIYSLK